MSTVPCICARCGAPALGRARITCADCGTLYCGALCAREHESSHALDCKLISAVGREQYAADTNATIQSSAATAIPGGDGARAAGPCRICLTDSSEGLAATCLTCDESLAHVACLTLGARITTAYSGEFKGWRSCRRCDARFPEATALALACECWRTYCSEDEGDARRINAMATLAAALERDEGNYAKATPLREAALDVLTRHHPAERENILVASTDLARCYGHVGRVAEAAALLKAVEASQARAAAEAAEAPPSS